MPRNGSGTYSLPSGNPVSAGTLIDATWANNTLNDLANEMTDSLSRSGEGGMLAPFRLSDGVQATPGLAWSNEPSTGFYRAGTNEMWAVVGGTQIQQFTATGTMARFAAGAVGTPSVSAFGDTNTGIWFPAADTVAVSTAGAEALRVNSSGVLSLVNNPTLSAGTANGVLYLNGSKVATSGANFTYDGTKVVLGSNGSFESSFSGNGLVLSKTNVGGKNAIISAADTSSVLLINNSAAGWDSVATYAAGSEGMRLTSTGLGIGTSSPNKKLDVDGGSIQVRTGGKVIADTLENYGTTLTLNAGGSLPIVFSLNGSQAMRLESGNLGLGVTPSAWRSNYKALQINTTGAVWSSPQFTFLSDNTYQDASDVSRYLTTAPAALYALNRNSGVHAWYNAPSGTAGNAITFTQAMTLDASGNLSVGTASASDKLHVEGSGSTAVRVQATNNGTRAGFKAFSKTSGGSSVQIDVLAYGDSPEAGVNVVTNHPLTFSTNNTERARITGGGNVLFNKTDTSYDVDGFAFLTANNQTRLTSNNDSPLLILRNGSNGTVASFWRGGYGEVGTISVTTTNTAYNTTSDVRLKENIATADDAGSVIDSIQIVKHDWKVGGHVRYGVIAQDLHGVAPEAVSAGDDGEEISQAWGVDYSKLVPMLVKEIQSLRARVAALEGA